VAVIFPPWRFTVALPQWHCHMAARRGDVTRRSRVARFAFFKNRY